MSIAMADVGQWLGARPARRLSIASVALVVLIYLVAGWSGMTRLGDADSTDSKAFKEYAALIGEEGRLPTEAENYEYSLPPGYPLIGAYLDRVVSAASFVAGRPLVTLPRTLRRGAWTILAAFGILALLLARERSRTWLAGLAAAVAAAAWAATYLMTYVHEQPWSARVLMTLALTAALVVGSALLAREAWPDRTFAPALAAAATALFPAVLRIGLVFHPDPLFALLSVVATLLVLRARRLDWAAERGIAVGATLGGAALVRQSAPVVMVALAVVVFVLGRRQALRFGAVALVATLPRRGPVVGLSDVPVREPIESNLDRPGYMLDQQPLSFFFSLPLPDLVTHPYRESFKNELLPKFHADLWSDWYTLGASFWTDRFLASTQQRARLRRRWAPCSAVCWASACPRSAALSAPLSSIHRRRACSMRDPLPARLGRLRVDARPVPAG